MSNRLATTNPDFHVGSGNFFTNLDLVFGVEVDTASGAIGIKEGNVILNSSSALAMTLALPTAGLPSAGGDDGRELTITNINIGAHTVTTPSNGINGSKHVATCGGGIGDSLTLVAYNGTWYTVNTPKNITLT